MYFLPDWYIQAKESNAPETEIRSRVADIMKQEKANSNNIDADWLNQMVDTYETMYESYKRCH